MYIIDVICEQIENENVSIEVINLLMKHGLDINKKRDGETFLFTSFYYGRQKVSKRLIELGIDIHAANSDGTTALHLACNDGATEIVRLLLNAGADPNVMDSDKFFPLLLSSEKDITKMLIEHGANVNLVGYENETALMSSENLDFVKLLVAAGADLNVKNKNGVTALEEFIIHGNGEMASFLIESGADVSEDRLVNLAIRRGLKNVVAQLVKNGADIDSEQNCGSILTALIYEKYDMIETLLNLGANIDVGVRRELINLGKIEKKSTGKELVEALINLSRDR